MTAMDGGNADFAGAIICPRRDKNWSNRRRGAQHARFELEISSNPNKYTISHPFQATHSCFA